MRSVPVVTAEMLAIIDYMMRDKLPAQVMKILRELKTIVQKINKGVK